MTKQFGSVPVHSYEITPKHLFLSRRDFIKTAGVIAGSTLLAACQTNETNETSPTNLTGLSSPTSPVETDELGSPVNTLEDITHYNNYYEFSANKVAVAPLSEKFTMHPWTIEVGGLVNNPKTFAIEDILKLFPQEERIYRLRCVEAWSMVIPWIGFPLADLLKMVEPTSDAKFVSFETVLRPKEMKGQGSPMYPWPYLEGLRIDEAMNDLAILATGLYGEDLPAQDGGPIRLVVPWKYGFKSIKAMVKIELVDKRPETFWNTTAPHEYGFYANVNPNVPHPRWLQTRERRIGEFAPRPTLLFNGYADQVSHLYDGMDLALSY